MKRMDRLLLLLLVAAGGCRAPMPTFNPLAPYGSTRVPPPATAGIHQPYYTPAGQPASGQPAAGQPTLPAPPTGFQASPPGNGWSAQPGPASAATTASAAPSASPTASGVPAPASGVALAGYQAPLSTAPTGQPLAAGSATNVISTDASALRLRGMPVNDATRPEPPTFVPAGPVIDITELPNAPPTIRLPNSSSSSVPVGTGVSVSGQTASASSSWETRAMTPPTSNSP